MIFFFFNDTATTEIYTLSLHDALPIFARDRAASGRTTAKRPPGSRDRRRDPYVLPGSGTTPQPGPGSRICRGDRKSTRLNSSHANISYAVFCLKKKKIHALLIYHRSTN